MMVSVNSCPCTTLAWISKTATIREGEYCSIIISITRSFPISCCCVVRDFEELACSSNLVHLRSSQHIAFQIWCWGQVLIFLKRHCTGVNLVKEGQGGLLPAGLQGWPLKFVQHVADATCIPPSHAGPHSSCHLPILYLLNLKFVIGMLNRCCILELRANQCFVCNFLRMPRCQCQIVLKKTNCLSCLT